MRRFIFKVTILSARNRGADKRLYLVGRGDPEQLSALMTAA
jgi:hypothetical protein